VLSLEDFEISLLMKELIWKEGTLIASRVSHGEYRDAIDNLAAGKLHPEALISAVLPLSETARAYKLLENGPGEYLKILLDPSR
jgi:threonine dehydrogenase-like Zn-dependent dehydrogenase